MEEKFFVLGGLVVVCVLGFVFVWVVVFGWFLGGFRVFYYVAIGDLLMICW